MGRSRRHSWRGSAQALLRLETPEKAALDLSISKEDR
jgi:hypothetical protein